MKKFFVNYSIFAFLYCLFGIFLLLHPVAVSKAICYIMGICAVFYGVWRIWGYWKVREMAGFFQVDLVTGVVLAVVGVAALLKPELLISILPAVLGLIIFMDGLVTISQAWNLKRWNSKKSRYLLGLGTGISVLGIVLVVNPFGSAMVMMRFLGITLLVDGLCELWWYYGLKKFMEN